jgi:hypothetical protein
VSRNARLVVSAAALTALLAVVAVASHAHRPGGGTTGSTPHAPTLLFDYIASAALVLFPLGAAVVVWAMAQGRHQRLLAGETNWLRTLAALGFMCAVLAGAVFLNKQRIGHDFFGGHPQTSHSSQGRAAKPGKPKQQPVTHQPEFQWAAAGVAFAIIAGLAGAFVYAYIRKRRAGGAWDREAALAVALDEVLADSLDDLRAEPDPRRAVIRAYARMERTFAAYGVAREEAEAPLEYMVRALDSLSVSSYSVRRLTQLFSRAKFSSHEVDAGMKDEAIEALVGLRAELEHSRAEAA